MGRFGNVMLVNGETDLRLTAKRGEVVRLYLTNTANTRVFRLCIPGASLKLIGSDLGRVEQRAAGRPPHHRAVRALDRGRALS